MTSAAAVILAGGSGSRVGAGVNKVYLPLAGRPLLAWSLRTVRAVAAVTAVVLVVRPQDADRASRIAEEELAGLPVDVVPGGTTRHASEQAALDRLAPRIDAGTLDVVVLHDGARPLATAQLWATVIEVAARDGGALPAVPGGGLLRVDGAGRPRSAPEHLVRVQTPQAFRAGDLARAYAAARTAGFEGTDTASTMEAFSALPVRVVPGSRQNLKVTYPHDVEVAARLVALHRPQ